MAIVSVAFAAPLAINGCNHLFSAGSNFEGSRTAVDVLHVVRSDRVFVLLPGPSCKGEGPAVLNVPVVCPDCVCHCHPQ